MIDGKTGGRGEKPSFPLSSYSASAGVSGLKKNELFKQVENPGRGDGAGRGRR